MTMEGTRASSRLTNVAAVSEKLKADEPTLNRLKTGAGDVFCVKITGSDQMICCYLSSTKSDSDSKYMLCVPAAHNYPSSWLKGNQGFNVKAKLKSLFSSKEQQILDLEKIKSTTSTTPNCYCNKGEMQSYDVDEMSSLLRSLNSSVILLRSTFLDKTNEVKEYLWYGESDLGVVNHNSETPLHICCRHDYVKTFNALVRRGFDFNKQDTNGKVAFQYAIENNSEQIIYYLLGHGSSLINDDDCELLITYFQQNSSASPVSVLDSMKRLNLKSNIQIKFQQFICENITKFSHHKNCVTENNVSLLMWMIIHSNHNVPVGIHKLFRCDPDVNIVDSRGHTALYTAIYNVKSDLVTLLLEAGADTNAIAFPITSNNQLDHSKPLNAYKYAVSRLEKIKPTWDMLDEFGFDFKESDRTIIINLYTNSKSIVESIVERLEENETLDKSDVAEVAEVAEVADVVDVAKVESDDEFIIIDLPQNSLTSDKSTLVPEPANIHTDFRSKGDDEDVRVVVPSGGLISSEKHQNSQEQESTASPSQSNVREKNEACQSSVEKKLKVSERKPTDTRKKAPFSLRKNRAVKAGKESPVDKIIANQRIFEHINDDFL